MESKGYLPKSHVDILPCMATFAVVVESGSFVEASVRLGVTASSISKQITKLESALSLRLLERTTRNLKLNPEGEEVYGYCKSVLESSADVFRLKDKLTENPQGLIRIAVTKSLYAACSKLIPAFLSRYREVDVQMLCGERFDFISDGIDLGIIITDKPPEGMIARRLCEIDFVICAAENYFRESSRPNHPSDLTSHSCIPFVGDPNKQCWRFSSVSESCDVVIPGRYLSECPEATLTATLSGVGISCLPVCLAAEAIGDNRLQVLLPDWVFKGEPQGTAWVVYQSGRFLSKRVKVMVSYLLSELAAASQGWKKTRL
ncbi:LysR family transcriptional regulator [Pseudomonas putida]|uniref:LysR family transcriptional regulator n=1 Tax=Pseudomonas putida TaxID=303 RepID=UPI0021F858B5|nr:LysR family transcriptional regulator [Pseudomonas putida]